MFLSNLTMEIQYSDELRSIILCHTSHQYTSELWRLFRVTIKQFNVDWQQNQHVFKIMREHKTVELLCNAMTNGNELNNHALIECNKTKRNQIITIWPLIMYTSILPFLYKYQQKTYNRFSPVDGSLTQLKLLYLFYSNQAQLYFA